MKNRFFFVINISDNYLGTILDGIRLLADSNQKHNAHITVRGPYETKRVSIKDYSIEIWNSKINGEEIKVDGISNFYSETQNTIFFECKDSDFLKDVWKKVTYNDFKPHITIYDGNDRDQANLLLNTISNYNINFSFKVNNLSILETTRFNLWELSLIKNTINYKLLSNILGIQVDSGILEEMELKDKFALIKRLCVRLESYTNQNFSSDISENKSDLLVDY